MAKKRRLVLRRDAWMYKPISKMTKEELVLLRAIRSPRSAFEPKTVMKSDFKPKAKNTII